MPIRMAQYGTRHGHAAGKLHALLSNDEVEFAGIYEPDADRRANLKEYDRAYSGQRWYGDVSEMLEDSSIMAIASEGLNAESLAQTEEIIRSGKHVWYDKPAGDNWTDWQRVVALSEEKNLHIQMGYMFRYHDGFSKIANWARSGFLGQVFSIRAHMSTSLPLEAREVIRGHQGGIFYDLAGHMLDQVVWILGRPINATGFFHNDTGDVPLFMDNTLGVFEFDNALAFVDIAAMEPGPTARRFEVYGTDGSAILLEPFEPGAEIRLALTTSKAGYQLGEQRVPVEVRGRQEMYDLELVAFLRTITGQQQPDRPIAHELTVQETLLRATRDMG